MLKRGVPVLITVMLLVLGGIVFIQYLWIRKSIAEKQNLIDNQVIQAMTNVDNRLSDFRTMAFFSPGETINFEVVDSLIYITDTTTLPEIPQLPVAHLDQPGEIRVEVRSTQSHAKDSLMFSQTRLMHHYQEADSLKQELSELEIELFRLNEVRDVFNQIRLEVDPLTGGLRLDSAKIDELLKTELQAFGLDTLVVWSVYDKTQKSYCINPVEVPNYRSEIPLFKKDLIDPGRYLLQLNLTNNSNLVWEDIRVMIISSVTLIVILLGVFVFSIRLILKHKKISQIKSDFMNNMTHEFKTPLASISLAADSILHPLIVKDPQKVEEYIQVIRTEKNKLNQNVERILEVASLEKDQLELPSETFDLEKLIRETVANLRLLIEKSEARILLNLDSNVSVTGSPFHLSQAIANVLENGIKYSTEKPMLSVSLSQTEKMVQLKISDQGIGMSPDQLHRVFDTFYRAQTGNIHNTKGFGLGLSYARFIVVKMGGDIRISSEIGKGTIITIELPTAV